MAGVASKDAQTHRSPLGEACGNAACQNKSQTNVASVKKAKHSHPPDTLYSIAARIRSNMLFPDSGATGCFAVSFACSMSSSGISFRKGEG